MILTTLHIVEGAIEMYRVRGPVRLFMDLQVMTTLTIEHPPTSAPKYTYIIWIKLKQILIPC